MSNAARRRRREPWDDWLASDQGPSGVRLLSPTRLLLVFVVVLAAAVAAWGLFLDRTGTQLPLTVAGLGVTGAALGLLGFSWAGAAAGLAGQGALGRSMLVAFFGGLCVLAAAGCVGAALILGILVAAG
jgi:hypothetical protein